MRESLMRKTESDFTADVRGNYINAGTCAVEVRYIARAESRRTALYTMRE